jgi:hypothetical protein
MKPVHHNFENNNNPTPVTGHTTSSLSSGDDLHYPEKRELTNPTMNVALNSLVARTARVSQLQVN